MRHIGFSPAEWNPLVFRTSSEVTLVKRCPYVMTATTASPFFLCGTSGNKCFLFSARKSYCGTASWKCAASNQSGCEPVTARRTALEGSRQAEVQYKDSVNLPKTNFSLRANAVLRELEIQKLWDDNQVFRRVVSKNSERSFIIHDGPPYANGSLHIGHALNKILKDIINRYKLLQNYRVCYRPGWDCHGLPIELKVLQSMDQNARKELSPLKFREKAAKFAKETVKAQMKSFKRYGVWADWENHYLTLAPDYEAAQIGVFGEMAMRGYIYRGRKPVHWSPSSRTALAEAELEFPESHTSKSIYVMFKLLGANESSGTLLEDFLPDVFLVIWTTTPWTVPANAAVAVNAEILYSVIQLEGFLVDACLSTGKKNLENVVVGKKSFLVVASELVSTLQSKWRVKLSVKKTFRGSALENYRYMQPISHRECPVVIGGDYITTECGTGLVHIAPGHGQEDYKIGQKYGLPALCPVDDDGRFTEEAGDFCGLDVLGDGNTSVIKYLDDHSLLLMEESYRHKYPYDWRTKKPTILRATEQWFASVDGFREAAMEAVRKVQWIPPQAENRIAAMISSRSDWCISRQRTWGVPIPVFYHISSKQHLMNEETVSHIKSVVSRKGSDAWWYMTVEELLPDGFRHRAREYQKGTDTMDVWFDSGSSWASVLPESVSCQADLSLEGSDQHRGWFQSSLLTCAATKGRAPFSQVITHGFVLDEKGLKMSKSLGNVVDPSTVIEGGENLKEQPGYGADVLRLWVSSVDYASDVVIGPQILQQMAETYRKLRGTLRFLLGNLHDWKPENAVQYVDLPKIDQYALFQFGNVINKIKGDFESYQFSRIFQVLQRFTIVFLSNFYFDAAKDRLYCGGIDGRRSCQTVLAHLMDIARLIAPILPHLAEDAWQHLPYKHYMEDGRVAQFVFEASWPIVDEIWTSLSAEDISLWEKVLELRTVVNKVLEVARTRKLIGSSLEAKVCLHADEPCLSFMLQKLCTSKHEADNLHHIFITSQVEVLSSLGSHSMTNVLCSGSCVVDGASKIWIGVSLADGSKCARCYTYSREVGSYHDSPFLCGRCHRIIYTQPSKSLLFARTVQ